MARQSQGIFLTVLLPLHDHLLDRADQVRSAILLHAELDARGHATLLAVPDGYRLVLDAGGCGRHFEIGAVINFLFRLLFWRRNLLRVTTGALLLLQRRVLLRLVVHLRVVHVHRVHAVRWLRHALAALVWERRHLAGHGPGPAVEMAEVLMLVNWPNVLVQLHIDHF